jgi:uncharacterized membrane protein YeiB
MSNNPYGDSPKKASRLFTIFCVYLAILLIAEFFIHKHSYFPWEDITFFYALYGFIAFVFMILFAKHILRPLIKRKEDYYD